MKTRKGIEIDAKAVVDAGYRVFVLIDQCKVMIKRDGRAQYIHGKKAKKFIHECSKYLVAYDDMDIDEVAYSVAIQFIGREA